MNFVGLYVSALKPCEVCQHSSCEHTKHGSFVVTTILAYASRSYQNLHATKQTPTCTKYVAHIRVTHRFMTFTQTCVEKQTQNIPLKRISL